MIMLPETDGESQNTAGRLKGELDQWNQDANILDFPLTFAIGSAHWNSGQDRDVEDALKEAECKSLTDG